MKYFTLINDLPRFYDLNKCIEQLVETNGCYMVIGDEVLHLKQNEWTMADTCKSHTAFNGSLEPRVYLVAVILGNR